MRNEKNYTLLETWVALWKFHLVFYPIYLWILYDMVPEIYDPSNENPPIVQKLLTLGVIIMGVMGVFRFAYIWYKDVFITNKNGN
jgi:hypothetical protein